MKSMLQAPRDYDADLAGRKRRGLIWSWLFQASTVVGVIALATLLLNITNGAFGYVALQARVDPNSLAIDGIPLEQQTKAQLIELLHRKLSTAAFNKLQKERPFEQRLRSDVYGLVLERVVRYDVLELVEPVGVPNTW